MTELLIPEVTECSLPAEIDLRPSCPFILFAVAGVLRPANEFPVFSSRKVANSIGIATRGGLYEMDRGKDKRIEPC